MLRNFYEVEKFTGVDGWQILWRVEKLLIGIRKIQGSWEIFRGLINFQRGCEISKEGWQIIFFLGGEFPFFHKALGFFWEGVEI